MRRAQTERLFELPNEMISFSGEKKLRSKKKKIWSKQRQQPEVEKKKRTNTMDKHTNSTLGNLEGSLL